VQDTEKHEPIPWGLNKDEKVEEKKRWARGPDTKEKRKMMK
jgi:hypothetical protein